MAGEEGPLTIEIRAADEKVASGRKGPFLNPCTAIHLSAMDGELRSKRKASEAAAGEECASKRKVEAASTVSAAVEQAPERKMTRLPQEEVNRILEHVVDDRVPYYFESLKRQNPSLLPSPEEEADRSKVVLYTAARVHYAGGESFHRLQGYVRGEYEKRGYVEVEEDFLARRAQVKAWSDAARARVLKNFAAAQDQDQD